MLQIIKLIEANYTDSEIAHETGFNRGKVVETSTKYWEAKMKQAQIDDYLKQNFPGGNLKQAGIVLGVSQIFLKRRIIYLRIDPDMIFETITIKTI